MSTRRKLQRAEKKARPIPVAVARPTLLDQLPPCPTCGNEETETGPCGTCGLLFSDCYGQGCFEAGCADVCDAGHGEHEPVSWADPRAGVPPFPAGDSCPRCARAAA